MEMLYTAYSNICLSIIYILSKYDTQDDMNNWRLPHCQKCPHLSVNPRKVELKPPTKNTQACNDTYVTHT